ncbi:transcriptional regulator [Thermoanaerobacterium thermosaccharolyticum]|uniref:Transcriptional regulator n=1 Tax=Thermoanaerobacterium thermosaccharolyticum TaxID=1517 RepID=A0A223I0L9_THETR|nr:transcriptional regulator [Thermoanaerobacterium thermosaccharolyticum]
MIIYNGFKEKRAVMRHIEEFCNILYFIQKDSITYTNYLFMIR